MMAAAIKAKDLAGHIFEQRRTGSQYRADQMWHYDFSRSLSEPVGEDPIQILR